MAEKADKLVLDLIIKHDRPFNVRRRLRCKGDNMLLDCCEHKPLTL